MKKCLAYSILITVFIFSFFTLPHLVNASYSWSTIGDGVTKSVISDPVGEDILIVYGGYTVKQSGSEKWAEALVNTTLKDKGVKTIYAVMGPVDEKYLNKTVIKNTKLVADLIKPENYKTKSRIIVIDHSSGAYPAIEFLNQIDSYSTLIGQSITVFNIDEDADFSLAGTKVLLNYYNVVGHDTSGNKSYDYNNATAIKKDISVITTGCFGSSAAELTYCIHMRLINKEASGQLLASGYLDPTFINNDYNNITDANVEISYLSDLVSSTSTVTPSVVAKDPDPASITSTSAILKGTVNIGNYDPENVNVCFQYIDNKSYYYAKDPWSNVPTNNIVGCRGTDLLSNKYTEMTFTPGLTPDTTYHYRLSMIGDLDATTVSNEITFKTLADFTTFPSATDSTNTNTGTGTTTINNTTTGELIPCGTKAALADDNPNNDVCEGLNGWNNLMTLVNNVVNFVLFKLALPIAAIMFVYAGFELVTSGGSSEKKSKAKKIFTNVAIGLILAAAAWLIVNTILVLLEYKDITMFFK